ncbi:ion channel [Desulfitobacterium sp.]|uniref:ion channel n=1 Tax=Desulfitobacterium sp. TaxID=49981 RepID=UPI002B73627F|nr:ion channel [Desulfitobacterium sp.]HVJ49893.1 ion channel [Desulfitobacterium sp.]
MGQWDEMKGQYPPHIWYPSQHYPTNSTFLDEGRGTFKPPMLSQQPEHRVTERDIVAANIWPLVPAIVGAGASFLLLLMANHKKWRSEEAETRSSESCPETRNPPVGSAVVVIYSLLATAGVSFYVFSVLTATDGHIITAFVPVVSAITILLLYFAAAYDLEYHLVPGSFTGDHIGDDIVTELFTFVYFSITTFATASMGDFSPVSNASRMLVSLEVLFFIYIFTMGIVFFADS